MRQSGNHVGVNAQVIGAENYFETVIASDRNSVLAFAALGWCKFLTGLIEEAISLQEQAIRLSPRDPYIGNWYGRIGLVHLVYGGRPGRSCACPGRASLPAMTPASLDISPSDLDRVKARIGAEGLTVRGYRFHGDTLSRAPTPQAGRPRANRRISSSPSI